jgi:hypothetical protein
MPSTQSMEAAPKPAFKVTRSPFAPKITGQGSTGLQTSPMSLGSAMGPTPPRPTHVRKASLGRSGGSGETTPALLAVDFICAAVAIAAAVMMWLHR